MAFTLLRSSWSFSKLSYLLRSTPSLFISDALSTFDNRIHEAFATVIRSEVPLWNWHKAMLPCLMGGVNLCSTLVHSPAAYLSSIVSCLDTIQSLINAPSSDSTMPVALAPYIELVAEHADKNHWLSIEDIDVPVSQRSCISCY